MEFRPPVELRGQYLRLVPLSVEHLRGLTRAAAAPEIWEFLLPGDLREAERLRGFIEELLRRQASGSDLAFTALLEPELRPVGMTRYLNIRREDQVVEIGGSWLERPLWNSPLNTEAKLMMLTYAFEVEGCHRVELKTDLRNVRSQQAIERLGAQREGVLREHMLRPGGYYRSSVYYSILAGEWPERKARLRARLARPWARESGAAPRKRAARPSAG
jgi:RimJ/RimL family protein N-acetyltransferase